MKGVSYVTDEVGNRTGVMLDLKTHRRLWEDVYDRLLVESRRREPREAIGTIRKRLAKRSSKNHA